MPSDQTFFEDTGGGNYVQGHTAQYTQDGTFWKLYCITCGWESIACSIEEIRFDFRYHCLKTRTDHSKIDWDKLL